MSVWLHRRAIARAVAGELSVDAEQRLREHLRGCSACRAHYDRVASVAEAFALAAGRTDARADARARARLVAGLDAASAPSGPRRALPLRWTWAAVGLVPVAALALFLLRPTPAPSRYVAMRGGSATSPSDAPAALLIFASRKDAGSGHGPVRMVADLPASGEGRVSLDDYVQFSVRGLQAPAFVTVVGVDDSGDVHIYVPRAGTQPPHLAPSSGAVALGTSIHLAHGHRPGRLRIYGLLSAEPLPPERVRAAAAQVDRALPGAPALDLPVPQVSGLLTVTAPSAP